MEILKNIQNVDSLWSIFKDLASLLISSLKCHYCWFFFLIKFWFGYCGLFNLGFCLLSRYTWQCVRKSWWHLTCPEDFLESGSWPVPGQGWWSWAGWEGADNFWLACRNWTHHPAPPRMDHGIEEWAFLKPPETSLCLLHARCPQR